MNMKRFNKLFVILLCCFGTLSATSCLNNDDNGGIDPELYETYLSNISGTYYGDNSNWKYQNKIYFYNDTIKANSLSEKLDSIVGITVSFSKYDSTFAVTNVPGRLLAKEIPDEYKDDYPEEGLVIHKCIRYTDNALRRFFQTASRQPWYNNTLFVITADHTNLTDHKYYQTDLGGFCVPIIFFDPSGDIRPGMRDAIAQQIDIMPTVLGHLGYDKPYVAFGCDLFNTAPRDTWAVNYLNGIYQYVKGDYMLQFDGERTRAVYRFRTDPYLERNLAGRVKEQAAMERELKAIIQQYMERMTQNRLVVRGE